MFFRLLVCSVALAALLAIPAAARAEDKNTPPEKTCKKLITSPGVPHPIRTIAEINAIRAWAELASRYGEEYTMWHHAKSSRLKCKKIGKIGMILCQVTAAPCRVESPQLELTNNGTPAR